MINKLILEVDLRSGDQQYFVETTLGAKIVRLPISEEIANEVLSSLSDTVREAEEDLQAAKEVRKTAHSSLLLDEEEKAASEEEDDGARYDGESML